MKKTNLIIGRTGSYKTTSILFNEVLRVNRK